MIVILAVGEEAEKKQKNQNEKKKRCHSTINRKSRAHRTERRGLRFETRLTTALFANNWRARGFEHTTRHTHRTAPQRATTSILEYGRRFDRDRYAQRVLLNEWDLRLQLHTNGQYSHPSRLVNVLGFCVIVPSCLCACVCFSSGMYKRDLM